MQCPTLGNSNIQQVFVCLEDLSGVLQKPLAENYIVPAGDATMNQVPSYTESDEKSDSLDVLDQFQNAVTAGESSIPMLVRIPSGGGRIQGHEALVALMGDFDEEHNTYSFKKCRPTVSIWMRHDNLVRYGSGAVITSAEIPLSNEAGQHITLAAQFRQLGWAGRSYVGVLASDASADAESTGIIKVVDSNGVNAIEAYTVGAYVQNTTKDDTNTNAGYQVTAVNTEASTITISPAPATAWTVGDQIDAWLPVATPIGESIESRDTSILIGGMAGKLRSGTLSIGTPTSFANEVGDEYPGENADQKRAISLDISGYFRANDAKELGLGYKGYELPVEITLGKKTGSSLKFAMPRVKFNTPEIGIDESTITLTRKGAVMGVAGEDSLKIIQL